MKVRNSGWLNIVAAGLNLLVFLITGYTPNAIFFVISLIVGAFCFWWTAMPKLPPVEKLPDYGRIAKHEHEFSLIPHIDEQTQEACDICRVQKKAERRTKFREQQDKYIAENNEEWLKAKRAQYGVTTANEERETLRIYGDNKIIDEYEIPGVTGFINRRDAE